MATELRHVEILAAIADGKPIDWPSWETRASSADEQRALRHLKVVAGVAELHRSLSAPAAAEAVQAAAGASTSSAGKPVVREESSPRDEDGEDTPTLPAQHWGHFDLLEEVGHGSFGAVYRARDRKLDREVAVKLLARRPGSRRTANVLREAKMLARVRHPNVATVYGGEVHGRRAGIWMEFVHGVTLADLVRRQGPLSASEATVIGTELSRALSAVHAAGLLHRDIKATNVMREERGRLVLMDFGAVELRQDADPSDVKGTPLYMAPELLDGRPADVRSDIYSVGVLLFYLVTGDYPFRAASVGELREAQKAGKRVGLADLRPDLPPSFVAVVEHAVAIDPAQRYPSAGAMLAGLARLLDTGSELLGSTERPSTTISQPVAVPPLQKVRRPWWSPTALALAGAAVIALAVGLGILAGRRTGGGGRGAGGGGPIAFGSIAVFVQSQTQDAQSQTLASGLSAEVARGLQHAGMSVHGRELATRPTLTSNDVARLDVDGLLNGTLSIVGQEFVLVMRLLEAGSDVELWKRTYSYPLEVVPRLHRKIAADLMSAMGRPQAPTAGAADTDRATSLRAYELVQRARQLATQRTEAKLLESVKLFEEATRLDPDYAPAWAGLADSYMGLGVPAFGRLRPQEARRLAHEAAQKALRIDPNLPEVETVLGWMSYFFDWNWAPAEEHFKRALALNPQYAHAHFRYADYLNAMGRQQEALEHLGAAAALEPLSIIIHRDYGWHYFHQRKFDQAVASLRETLERDPTYVPARTLLGRSLVEAGELEQGLAEFDKVARQPPRPTELSFRAYGEAAAGRGRRAEALLREAIAASSQEYLAPYYVALVYARLGRSSTALEWLEKAYREQDTTLVNLKIDPRWDGLRRTQGYVALVRRMNFPGN